MVVQGIIRPPPEIRAVADKTASFVAKNGRGFETRIMNSAKGKTPKFAFLHESSPFHAYYEDRILFYTNGGVDEEKKEEGVTDTKQPDKGAGEGTVVKQEQDQTESGAVTGGKEKMMARKAKSIVDPVARALLAQRSRIQRILDSESESNEEQSSSEPNDGSTANTEKESLIPPLQRYTVLLAPNNISLAQLEVIKLTAQFAALNGKGGSFLRDLTIREWNNPFWGFLQPRHSHYAYFTQLIELYRRLLQEAVVIHEIEMKQRSNEILGDQISLLELAKIRDSVGLDASLEEKEDIKNQINLIESTAGDVYKCLEYSAYHAEYDRYYEEKRRTELESMEGSGGLGGTAKIDWHDFVVVETIDFHVDEIVESLPPPPPPPPVSLKSDQVQTKEADTEMEESSDEDDEQIKVVEGYAPKVVSSQAKFSSESMTHVIDPITKKSIPIADMTEHMRIQLLDPKWAAEKAKFLEKQKESNLVSGDEIARNMMTFAKGRTDLFGTAALENEESRKRLEANAVSNAEPQMPQPLSAIATAVSPTNNVFPSHARPEVVAPDAKRLKLETTPAYGQVQLPPILPFTAPPPPPPPVAMPVATLPATSQPELEADQDTVPVETILSEMDFAKSLSSPNVPILIRIPEDSTFAAWNFCGQTISITVDVMATIKDIKQQIQSQLGGMPPNKMQLRKSNIGFLKDNLSLAYYNVGPSNNSLELLPKVRGGRR